MKTAARNDGFSLIELIITLFIIAVGLGSLYAVMYRGLDHMRIAGSRNYAVVAAASELEIIKAMSKTKLPDNYAGAFKGKVDLSALNNARGTLKIEDYKESGGRLKVVTAAVNWTMAGKKKRVTLSTLLGNP